MAWNFLYIVRRNFHGDDNWGEMYIKTTSGRWEWLSYTYELPWKSDGNGKSSKNVSRIKIGTYELNVRIDGLPRRGGGKGWRLELQNTGHRTNIQIHRATPSLYIKGCILPVHFNNLQSSSIKRGDMRISTKSEKIMDKIEARLKVLNGAGNAKGKPAVKIVANMPAELVTNRSYANV